MSIIERNIKPNILEALKRMPVVFLNGPRQAGKSTLAQMLISNSWPATYITLDEPTQMGAAQANPKIFLQAHDGPLIIDEVQMAPELFYTIKMIVDDLRYKALHSKKEPSADGRFLLTGSTSLMSLPTLTDALVGRMAIITLYPLSVTEVSKSKANFLETLFANSFRSTKKENDYDLVSMMSRATFPEIANEPDNARRQWFESYIMSILQRDVRQIAHIEKLGVLPNLLKVLASRAGSLLNEADIARAIKQNAVTTKNYRTLLQMIFLVFDVYPWFSNIGKRLVKAPKGYIIDTSLLCHLQQIDLKAIAQKDASTFGHVLENFVATELLKQLTIFDADLFHFRTSDGKEVDFVLQKRGGPLAGIEVKANDNVKADDFRGLKELQQSTSKSFACGIVLYRGKKTIAFAEKLWAVPISALWQAA